jgi:hypothetical protein
VSEILSRIKDGYVFDVNELKNMEVPQ